MQAFKSRTCVLKTFSCSNKHQTSLITMNIFPWKNYKCELQDQRSEHGSSQKINLEGLLLENFDFVLKGKRNLGRPNNEFPRGCFLQISKYRVKSRSKILFQLQRILAIKVSMKGTQGWKEFPIDKNFPSNLFSSNW